MRDAGADHRGSTGSEFTGLTIDGVAVGDPSGRERNGSCAGIGTLTARKIDLSGGSASSRRIIMDMLVVKVRHGQCRSGCRSAAP